ncbi:hypothetical protein GWG65_02050 [Bradyrhizobium sp. CSA207]|uniref:hypothetical protein n=1 Tax=Bradyrhizobium sp. CSA207 TaxID=2698826 RepID=UPI0023B0FD36|nr:hypothetical protein [Bradyrhizobium sp. CSA207]MDE5440245.1 hypothetical protein [Bradyrhizobium sp. CSA207]
MNVFKRNEEERAKREAQDAPRRTETIKRRSEAAARLETDLKEFLREGFLDVGISRSEEIVTLTGADKMTLVITVMDDLYSLEYPGATDVMAQHRKNFGCYVMEKQMTAKVADWLNGKP